MCGYTCLKVCASMRWCVEPEVHKVCFLRSLSFFFQFRQGFLTESGAQTRAGKRAWDTSVPALGTLFSSCWVAMFSLDITGFALSYCTLFCRDWLLSLGGLLLSKGKGGESGSIWWRSKNGVGWMRGVEQKKLRLELIAWEKNLFPMNIDDR